MLKNIILNLFKFIFLKKYKYVFYSEIKNYQVNYLPLILKILEENEEILYISSDKNDFISHKLVKNIFIESRYERYMAFMLIRAKFFFLTVINLNNNELKKTKNVDYYVYIFHSMKSCHKDLPLNSFDHYDIILCCGPHQDIEIRKLELINKTSKKKIIKAGYLYSEFFNMRIVENKHKFNNSILLAFSWSYKENNFFEKNLIELIDKLIPKEKIILRPHPEHFKRSLKTIQRIKEKFGYNKNFYLDESESNLQSMLKSKLVMTDNSGISLEFLFLLKKPVIYFDDYNRIQNEKYYAFNLIAFEDIVKKKFGNSVEFNEINNIDELIKITFNKFNNSKLGLNSFIENNIYNYNLLPSKEIYDQLQNVEKVFKHN